jgi:hypothetical protein
MDTFSDESCSAFADSTGGLEIFAGLTGQEIPYGITNLIDMDCFSCKEPHENTGNDNDDGDEVAEVCETVYNARKNSTTASTLTPTPTHATTFQASRLCVRTEPSSLLTPRPTRLPLASLVPLLFRSFSCPLTSTTSRPSSTERPSIFRSKKFVTTESDRQLAANVSCLASHDAIAHIHNLYKELEGLDLTVVKWIYTTFFRQHCVSIVYRKRTRRSSK